MYCNHCGKKTDGNHSFCIHCGQKINPPYTRQSTTPNYKQSGSSGTVWWALGLVSALIGIALIFAGNEMDGNYSKHLEHIFEYGSKDSTGSTLVLFGIVLAIAGGIMFTIGIIFSCSSKPVAVNKKTYHSYSTQTQHHNFAVKNNPRVAFCINCGQKLEEGQKYCFRCGESVYNPNNN